MPKAFSEHEKERIKKQLLEQGYKQFSAYGLKKTNIEELAEAAGISKGAFYLFYESKEAFFMDVAEQVEERYRLEVLAGVDRSQGAPRARLFGILKHAFSLWKQFPILEFFNQGDFEILLRRVPEGKIREHLSSDRVFVGELMARCRQMGIDIRVSEEQFNGLLYGLLFTSLHDENFGPYQSMDMMTILLELVAAYCLGEVELQAQPLSGNESQPAKDGEK